MLQSKKIASISSAQCHDKVQYILHLVCTGNVQHIHNTVAPQEFQQK